MSVYYNDSDAFVCAWLRNLIAAKLLPVGDVDERPIEHVQASDVAGYTQAHFFAGIGGWPYALQLAGWGDRPVWTGSCPCQSLSGAGSQHGDADKRHVWPAFYRLISECRPSVVFGEQVASKLGREWLAGVRADLESVGYAVGCADLCAASIGAPHKRQRLWFMGDATVWRLSQRSEQKGQGGGRPATQRSGDLGTVANTDGGHASAEGIQRSRQHGQRAQNGGASLMAHAECRRLEVADLSIRPTRQVEAAAIQRGPNSWSAADWISCADGSSRPVEPGTFPLAHGIPQRVGRLRAYGNAIVPQVAAAFVKAYLGVAAGCAPRPHK